MITLTIIVKIFGYALFVHELNCRLPAFLRERKSRVLEAP